MQVIGQSAYSGRLQADKQTAASSDCTVAGSTPFSRVHGVLGSNKGDRVS